MLRPQPLHRHRDDAAGVLVGAAAGRLLDVTRKRCRLSPRLVLHPLQDLPPGIGHRQSRHPFEPGRDLLFPAVEFLFPLGQFPVAPDQLLLPLGLLPVARSKFLHPPVQLATLLLGAPLLTFRVLAMAAALLLRSIALALQQCARFGFGVALEPGSVAFRSRREGARFGAGRLEKSLPFPPLAPDPAHCDQSGDQRTGEGRGNERPEREGHAAPRFPRLAGGSSRATSPASASTRSAISRSPRRA